MNAILQDQTFLPSCTLAKEHRRRRDAHDWSALAVAALAFVGAGVAVWLG